MYFSVSSMEKIRQEDEIKINTFVFFDIETSGFNSPKEKMIELAMIAVSREDLLCMKNSEGNMPPSLPRVIQKLRKLFYPYCLIDPSAEKVHGLSNENLEHLSSFNKSTAENLRVFLEDLPHPVCITAHNGNRHDFPILQAELVASGYVEFCDLLCVDSLLCVRELESKVTDLFKNNSKYLCHPLGKSTETLIRAQKENEDPSEPNNADEDTISSSIPVNASPSIFANGSSLQDYSDLSEEEKVEFHASSYLAYISDSDDDISQNSSSNFADTFQTPEKQPRTSTPKTPRKCDEKLISSQTTPETKKNNNSIGSKGSACKRTLYYNSDGEFLSYKTPFSQPVLYKRLFGTEYEAHHAENDAETLLQVCSFYGHYFVEWADKHYKYFKDIKPKWKVRKSFVLVE